MIVSFNLTENMDSLRVSSVLASLRIRIKTPSIETLKHSCVVFIGRKNAFAVQFVRIADHLEQRKIAFLSIDFPGGVKDFVSAMFGISLGEHHQLYVMRIAPQRSKAGEKVIHFVLGEG